MNSSDLVLYRRMRGLFWVLIVGVVMVLPTLFMLGVTVPSAMGIYSERTINEFGGAGSTAEGGFLIIAVLASLAAVILGATAGSIDHQRGVIRDLLLAGRSRSRVVVGRTAAATTWLVAAAAVAGVIVLALSVGLPPVPDVTIDWEQIARIALGPVPSILGTLPFVAGVAMLVGSRGIAIAVYFILVLVVDNVLLMIPKISDWWQHVSLSPAQAQVNSWIVDGANSFSDIDRPDYMALFVVIAWAVVPFTAGLVRLSRRDL